MKKILAFLLTATLLCAMFVMPSAAAENVNYEAEIPYVATAPVVDGTVGGGEYGDVFAMHSFSENEEQFVTSNDEFGDWDVEFYAAYDAEKLYMAWIVKSDVHAGLPKEDRSGDSTFDELDYGYMWEYSCVQFILTPGNPTSGDNYSGNFLEVGLCLLDDGEQARVAWNYPKGVDEADISLNDWDAVINRDETAGTTTYEIAIPKSMSGLQTWGSGAEFGLSYAAAAQENYNTKKGMLEWQDAILGSGKLPNNCAVMTLADSEVGKEDTGLGLQEGELPEDAADTVQIAIDKVGGYIQGEDALLVINDVVNAVNDYDNNRCTNLALLPVEGSENEYEVVDVQIGDGENLVAWDTDLEQEGIVVLSINSDGGIGKDRLEAVNTIGEGSLVKLFGVDLAAGELLYSNAMIYVTELVEPSEDEESSEEPSEDVSEEVPEEESSEEESKEESKTSTSKTSSVASTADEGDSNGGVIIAIVIGVVVVIAAVVAVIVIKKKKA